MNPRTDETPGGGPGDSGDRQGSGSSSSVTPTSDKPADYRTLYADLSAHGVPVILCTPNPRWTPDNRATDLEHPTGWEDTEPAPDAASGYVHGVHTGAMVTGHALDCIDLDPKNGCDLKATMDRAAACGVSVVGIDVSPSGGLHLFLKSTGIRSTTSKTVGIDFCGGGRIPDAKSGYGRHLVYLPGASRPKYPGKDYSTVQPVDWDALAELHEGDQRDALWTFLAGVGLNPRLEAAPARDVVAEGDVPEFLSDELARLLTDVGPTWDTLKGTSTDRSERFHHLVNACQREGLTQGQTVAVVRPWCEAVGKYVGRVAEEVARSLSKPDELTAWTGPGEEDSRQDHHDVAGVREEDPRQDDDLDEVKPEALRRVVLTSAADIEPLPTTWTWEQRLPTGALGLIAGPEGTGKSTCAYWTVAQLTRGRLPGIHKGTPKAVLIAATEDSWARTIVPRLIAAGADLSKVWRVDVSTVLGTGGYLTLPKDIGGLSAHARETGAALLLLDPIMSRLEAGLDTHKDAETRRALEPIAALADSTGMSVLGLIHFNKGGSADVLNNVMASKAFTAVARSVSTVIRDPNDDTGRTRIFGTPKSNLGRDDLPLLPFQLAEHTFHNRAGDLIVTSRIEWLSERSGTIDDLMRQARDTGQDRTIVAEVAEWLAGYLEAEGDCAPRKDIVDAGKRERFTDDQLKRGFKRLQLAYRNTRTKPRATYWMTVEEAKRWDERENIESQNPSQSTVRASSRGESPTTLTTLTRESGPSQSSRSSRSNPPREGSDCAVCSCALSPSALKCPSCGEPVEAPF